MGSTVKINVLSGGAIEPGLLAAVAAFQQQSGYEVTITWATAPAIQKRIANAETFDVVIAPPAVVEGFAQLGNVIPQEGVSLGRVGVGIVMHERLPAPDISSADAIKRAVLAAESVVFNRASSGLYVETLLRKMGIYEQIEGKITRFANGPAMMDHLINAKTHEIAFGAIIEILMFRDQGLKLVAPLPADIQHYTNYTAAPMTGAFNAAGARTLLQYFATPASQALFKAHGIE